MATIYIFIIIGIIVGFLEIHNGWSPYFWGYVFGVFFGGVIGAIVGFVVAIALPMDLYEKHETYKVVSLQDGSNVKGNFFLGCGTIEGKMQYVFYYEENGMYRMAQVPYDDVSIKYTDKAPVAQVYTITATDAFINNLAGDFSEGDKRYIIEVPKGTIQSQYNLDAQ